MKLFITQQFVGPVGYRLWCGNDPFIHHASVNADTC